MKLIPVPTLADSICDLRTRKIKQQFFTQINTLLDWNSLSSIIDKHYKKGKSATGKPSYDGLLLFRMCLLQTWYGLSDYEVEDRVNDSISFIENVYQNWGFKGWRGFFLGKRICYSRLWSVEKKKHLFTNSKYDFTHKQTVM